MIRLAALEGASQQVIIVTALAGYEGIVRFAPHLLLGRLGRTRSVYHMAVAVAPPQQLWRSVVELQHGMVEHDHLVPRPV